MGLFMQNERMIHVIIIYALCIPTQLFDIFVLNQTLPIKLIYRLQGLMQKI